MGLVNVRVKIKDQGKLNAELKKLSVIRANVKVGFFASSTYPNGTPVAAVAYANEYGANGIPARPFMRKTVNKNIKKWVEGIRKNIKGLGLNRKSVELAYKRAGMVAVGDMKKTIKQWPPGGNKPATVARKKARAKSGKNTTAVDPETVLIDTGKMISSVAYEVKS